MISLRKTIKYGLILAGAFFLLFVGLLLVIKLYFPAEEIKRIAENQIEKIIKTPVSVNMALFNPLRGVELKDILIGDKDHYLLSVKTISLLYDFKQLISERKLIINRINIHKPTVNLKYIQNQWNIPLIKQDDRTEDKRSPVVGQAPEKFVLPVLPFAIDLNEFKIEDLSFSLNYDNNIKLKSSGISMLLKGQLTSELLIIDTVITSSDKSIISFEQASPQNVSFNSTLDTHLNISLKKPNNISIKGKIEFKKLSLFYLDHIKLNHFSVGLDLLLNMVDEKIKINKVNLSSKDFIEINAAGEANRILNQPKFNFTVSNSSINLGTINKYISTLVPDLNIKGKLGVNNIHLMGSLEDKNKLNAGVQGLIYFDNINVDYPKTDLSLKSVTGKIELKNLNLINNVPDTIDAEVSFRLSELISKRVSLTGLQEKIRIHKSKKTVDEQTVNFNVKLDEVKLHLDNQPSIIFPFTAHGTLVANINDLDVKNLLVEWKLPGAASGKIMAAYLTSNHKSFRVNNILDLDIEKMEKYIPVKYLEKTNELNLSGTISSKTDITGNLNLQYLPENMEFKLINNLKNINAIYPAYQIAISNLNTKSFIQGKYNKKGIELTEFELNGAFSNVKYSKQINIKKSKYSFQAKSKGLSSFTNPFGTRINIDGTIRSDLVEIPPYQTELKQLLINLGFNAVTSKEKILEKINLAGNISTINIRADNVLFSDDIKVAFNIKSPNLSFRKPGINLNLSATGLKFRRKNWSGLKNNITAHAILFPDIRKKSVVLRKVDVSSLPLFKLSLKEGMLNSDKKIDIQNLKIFLDMGRLWGNLPPFIKRKIPVRDLNGGLSVSASGKGKIPDKINPAKLDLPIQFNSNLDIANMSLEIDRPSFKINNLNSKSNINFGPSSINLSGMTAVSSITNNLQSIVPKLSNISYQYNYSLKDFNSVNIKKSILKIENGTIVQSLDGSVEGINFALSQNTPFNIAEALNKIRLTLNTSLVINSDKNISANLPLRFKGGLETDLSVKLVPHETLRLSGNIEFKKLNLGRNSVIQIKDITGNIPINKSYFLINSEQKTISSFQKKSNKFVSQSGLFSDLRSFSRHKDIIAITSMQAGKQIFSEILLDLYLQNNMFAIEQFSFELEGGTVLGNLYLFPRKKGHKLSLKSNFANIDLQRILKLKDKDKETINSKVNGNSEISVNLSYETDKGFNLDQIEMDLNITHIGENALDQILMFIDPNESNPSIANLKDKLKLARPSQVNIRLKNERLSLFIRLKTHLTESGFIDIQVLNKIPVQRLKQFSIITESLEKTSPVLKIISIWASNSILLKKNEIMFQ